MNKKELFARKCDVTGEGMNEGYCIGDGLMYIKGDIAFLNHITHDTDYKSIEEAYEDDYYYYTDWYEVIDEESTLFDAKGNEIKLN